MNPKDLDHRECLVVHGHLCSQFSYPVDLYLVDIIFHHGDAVGNYHIFLEKVFFFLSIHFNDALLD